MPRRDTIAAALLAPVLFTVAARPTATGQDLEGPPPMATSAADSAPRVAAGVTSLKLPVHREWTSTGLRLRRGERVRVRAWGRARIAQAPAQLVDPNGVDGQRRAGRLLADAPSFALIGVIGDDNNDYIRIGKEADFAAPRDGTLYLCLNQLDPSGNSGSFEVRVTTGNSSSLTFGAAEELAQSAAAPGPVNQTAADGAKVVQVVPTLDWTNTYLSVKRGDTVTVEASGRVHLDLSGRASGPDGTAFPDPGKLIPDKPTGALIAVIGDDNNDFIFVGAKSSFTAQRNGILFLGINEEQLVNNTGSFTARVRVGPASK